MKIILCDRAPRGWPYFLTAGATHCYCGRPLDEHDSQELFEPPESLPPTETTATQGGW